MRDWRGAVALVLATGVALSLVIGTTAGAIRGHDLTPDEITLLSTVLGASVGAVATYLGTGRAGGGGTLTRATDDRSDRMTDTERRPLEPGDEIEAEPDAEPTGTPVESEPDEDDGVEEADDETTEGMGPAPGES